MKTRFAPSPTGLMHFGNLRTALFNFLLAKKNNIPFLLRIEDTDAERSDHKYTNLLIEDLKKVGINDFEGPNYQSDRADVYNKYYKILEEKNLAYPCFCTEQELIIARKQQLRAGFPPKYKGTCRTLTHTEIEKRLEAGQTPTLRLKMPENEIIEFEDLVKGKQKFNSKDIGDFIIRRADGTAPFMYANAIDDSLMGVTHALRGDDHITNTPRQIYILRVLGLKEPHYGHFPLILGLDGAPLSKRNGSAAVVDLLNEGYLPLALINYLARLGHYYKENDFLTMDELAKHFDLKHVNNAPAKHDKSHMKHWQKEAILKESPESIWKIIKNYAEHNTHESQEHIDLHKKLVDSLKLIPKGKEIEFTTVIKDNILMPLDALDFAVAFFKKDLELDDDAQNIINEAPKGMFTAVFYKLENKEINNNKDLIEFVKTEFNLKGKKLFMPIRLAYTGLSFGPGLDSIFDLMGVELIKNRLKAITDL